MSVVIGNLGPPACTPAQALQMKVSPGTARLVCDSLTQEELKALVAHMQALGATVQLTRVNKLTAAPAAPAYDLPRPAFEEQVVSTFDRKGDPTTAWYTTLLHHALHTDRPQRCCVLWGPPGVGKTLAMERLQEMLRRQRAARTKERRVGVRLLGSERRLGVPEMRYFSCCDIENADDVAPFLKSVAEFVSTAPPDSIVVVDDVDAIAGEKSSLTRLFEIMAEGVPKKGVTLPKARCRRIMIVNDLYAKPYFSLRKKPLEDRFFDLRVDYAHLASLALFLRAKVPAIRDRERLAVAEALRTGADVDVARDSVSLGVAHRSGGDVRAALISAIYMPSSCDTLVRNEGLHVTILHCVRAERPVKEAHLLLEAEEGDDVNECMFANYPRYLSACDDQVRVLQAAADVSEQLSDAHTYDWANRNSGFEGGDGEDMDKQMLFSLSTALPVGRLARALAGTSRQHLIQPKLEFPLRKLIGVHNKRAEVLHNYKARAELVHRIRFRNAAQQLGALDGSESNMTGAPKHATCERGDLVSVLMRRANLIDEIRLRVPIKEVVQRFAAQAFTAVDFAHACLLFWAAHDWEHKLSERDVADAFERAGVQIVLDTTVVEGTNGRAKKRAAQDAEPAPAAKKQKQSSILQFVKK